MTFYGNLKNLEEGKSQETNLKEKNDNGLQVEIQLQILSESLIITLKNLLLNRKDRRVKNVLHQKPKK